jgi:hypothetical protein
VKWGFCNNQASDACHNDLFTLGLIMDGWLSLWPESEKVSNFEQSRHCGESSLAPAEEKPGRAVMG